MAAKNHTLCTVWKKGFIMSFSRLLFALAVVTGSPAWSHEFWIEPEQYQVESDAPIIANLRNGENFKGIALAWFDKRFTRFDLIEGETARPVTGRMGDRPALQTGPAADGLLIVVHETTPTTLTYRKWEKFEAFVAHKDFKDAIATHKARGWPTDKFREEYTRHAKALIAVGDGAGSDRPIGMETEFIALTNPYADDFDGTMQVHLTYQDAPRADAQVEVFARAPDGSVEVSLYRTDGSGQARIPVTAGYEYLFDAVVLRPSPLAGTEADAPVWRTLWAALTFAVPAQ